MKRVICALAGGFLFVGIGVAQATETITYAYDAKGRLMKVVHAGSVNDGVTVDYTHDPADNRVGVKVNGAH